MHRCYIAPERWQSELLIPDKEEAHHLSDVLRVAVNDPVMVFDGAGRRVPTRVVALRPHEVELRPTGSVEMQQRPRPFISLIQAIPKGTRMDTVVEKGTELGMDRLVPVMTERTITRLDESRARSRRKRWVRIAHGATRQCGVDWIPDVAPVQSLSEALANRAPGDVLLVGALFGTRRPMASVVDELAQNPPPSISLLVGPEGDLSPSEMDVVCAAGAVGVSMGPLVLRTDTAALFGLSVLASRLR